MYHNDVATFVQILLVVVWYLKMAFHFSYLKSIRSEYKDRNVVFFILNIPKKTSEGSKFFDRFYVNSPFFRFPKNTLSEDALKRARKTFIVTLMLWIVFVVMIAYML